MSQHYFETQFQNRAVQIVLGYDRPLDCFFLTIMYMATVQADENDAILYSNLEDPAAGFHQDLDYYRAKLKSFGIAVPESMFRQTEQDAVHRVGNRVVLHHEGGRMETIG